MEGTIARFSIECSSGTYIRSLAHEMGQKLGCGAHLAEITRTAVGEFSLEQAVKLEELAEATRAGKFTDYLIRLDNLLPNFPRVNVLPIIERRVRHGTKFNISVSQIQPGRVEPPPGATSQLDGGEPRPPRLRVFSQQNSLIAIAEAVVPRTYQPVVVFEPLP
jgi:tRNA pseudouridine55 synthase